MEVDELSEPVSQETKERIWASFGRAIGTEPREAKSILGASGLEHPVQSISVDDKNRRVVVVVGEPNPRTAALVQTDIQATMTDARVLVARPVVIDFAAIARKIFSTADRAFLDLPTILKACERLKKLPDGKRGRFVEKRVAPIMTPYLNALNNVAMPGLAQLIDIIQQGAHLDWKAMTTEAKLHEKGGAPVSLAKMFEIDNLAIDRSHGVCPLPLYGFNAEDWEAMARGTEIDAVKERLKAMGIYQFFFPAPDQLALGLVDHGLMQANEIVHAVERAPTLGHLFAANELTHNPGSVFEMIDQLKEQGFLAEGEFGIEDTPDGRKARSLIKFKPQESIFQRILSRITVSLSLKDLFPPH